jgi:DNA helicase II / ATP-dependent DNA helicase PcrA
VRSVDTNKLRSLVDAEFSGNDARMYGNFCQKLVGLARGVGIGCLAPDVEATWIDLIAYHDLELEDERGNLGTAIELAQKLLELSKAAPAVDFDDMLYLPVKDGLSLPKFDYVFVDEAQDTNAIQRALLRKILKPSSRLIAVGDPAQAIYGFRGADSNSMNLIAQEFDCKRLPLTVSYRCGTEIVRYAQQWVDHIEAAPNAIAGRVVECGTDWKVESQFQPDDLVVCRTTRPLITLAYRMMRAKVPCFIMGREIGQGLKAVVNKMKATNVEELGKRLDVWRERECEKALSKGNDAKVEAIEDKAEAIWFLVDTLPETQRHIPGLLALIDSLFAEGVNKVRLATIHKSKGLEADTVHWLNRSQCPSKWARQVWQKEQESNLCYVASTRAKCSLYIIEEPRNKQPALNGGLL